MLKQTFHKFHDLEAAAAREKGPFDLFALFLRHDTLAVWEVVVSAPWLSADETGGLRYLTKKLQEKLTPEELLSIAGVVILDEHNPVVKSVRSAVAVEHGGCELVDCAFNGMPIRRAYVITSRRKTRVA